MLDDLNGLRSISRTARPARADVWRAFDGAGHGRGTAVEISGDPGIGKSTLLCELADDAARRGLRTLFARSTAGSHGVPAALAEAAQAPSGDGLLLLLDDFHWADAAAVDLVGELLNSAPAHPLRLVIAHRPRQASPYLRSVLAHGVQSGAVRRIKLSPLSLRESAELLGLDEDDARLPRLYQDAEGNPLYLQTLAEQELPSRPVGEPGLLADLLLSETVGLDSHEEALVRAAAVLGERSTVDDLAEVAELRRAHACAAVTRLVQRDLLRPTGPLGCYAFRHRSLQQVVHRNLDGCWAGGAHRRALGVLRARGARASELAAHIERSLPEATADDLHTLVAAAEDHLWQAPETACHWLSTALKLLPDGKQPPYPQPTVPGSALVRARDLLYGLLSAADSPRLRALLVRLCAQVESYLGRRTEALALLGSAIADLNRPAETAPGNGPRPDGGETAPPELAALIVARSTLEALEGGMPSPEEIGLAMRIVVHNPDRLLTVGLLALRGLRAAVAHDTELSSAAINECAAAVDALSDLALLPNPEYLALLGWAEILDTRFTDALRHLPRGVTVSLRSGRTRALVPLLNALCYLSLYLGPAVAGTQAVRDMLHELEKQDCDEVRGMVLSLQSSTALWSDGDDRRAVMLAEQAVVALQPGDAWMISATLSLARAVADSGDPQRCIQLITNLGSDADLRALPPILRPLCFELLTSAAVALGDPAAAEWAAKAASSATQPFQHAYAATARAHVMANRDPGTAAELYREAAALFATVGMTAAQACALAFGASAACRAGRERDGAVMRLMAVDLARRCGATRVYTAMLEQQERAKVPRALDQDGPLTVLTGREHEVAVLAGTGKKTRDIAHELNLSPRTVDVHLTRIFRKLGIDSRAALARLMALAETSDRPNPLRLTLGGL